MIDISVIIPCYNRQDLIGEAIESALQGPSVEVIVVDDGSTDQSWEVVRSFGARITATQIENSGPAAARNRGLELARGRHVRFLDSDDRLPAGSLSAHLEIARALGTDEISVGDAVSIDGSGRRVTTSVCYGYAHIAPPGPLPTATVVGTVMPPVLPLYPTAVLRRVGGFDPTVSLMEDHEMALRILEAGYRFVRTDLIVYEVREHDGERLSRNLSAKDYSGLAGIYARAARRPAMSQAERTALGRLIWTSGRDAARAGYAREAATLFEIAQGVGGSAAWTGALPLKWLYRIVSPVAAERVLGGAKRALGRTGQ